ncbi:MAG: DUF2304 domain-containing protein [candidate division Zixibacteria bacterium]|nr:DUF2304 domain-containing protein [candidate division Zixibacteria bacterium]
MMSLRIQLLAIAACLLIIFFIISLIRKRKLREEYSIMWLIGSLALIVFAVWRDLLDIIAKAVGVFYAPAILLLVIIFFGVLIFLHITVVISRQTDQNKDMAQEISLLKNKIELLTEKLKGREDADR